VRPIRVREENSSAANRGFGGLFGRNPLTKEITRGRGGERTHRGRHGRALKAECCEIFKEVDGVCCGRSAHRGECNTLRELDSATMSEWFLGRHVLLFAAWSWPSQNVPLVIKKRGAEHSTKVMKEVIGMEKRERSWPFNSMLALSTWRSSADINQGLRIRAASQKQNGCLAELPGLGFHPEKTRQS